MILGEMQLRDPAVDDMDAFIEVGAQDFCNQLGFEQARQRLQIAYGYAWREVDKAAFNNPRLAEADPKEAIVNAFTRMWARREENITLFASLYWMRDKQGDLQSLIFGKNEPEYLYEGSFQDKLASLCVRGKVPILEDCHSSYETGLHLMSYMTGVILTHAQTAAEQVPSVPTVEFALRSFVNGEAPTS